MERYNYQFIYGINTTMKLDGTDVYIYNNEYMIDTTTKYGGIYTTTKLDATDVTIMKLDGNDTTMKLDGTDVYIRNNEHGIDTTTKYYGGIYTTMKLDMEKYGHGLPWCRSFCAF